MVKKQEIIDRLAKVGITGLCTKRVLSKAIHVGYMTLYKEVEEGRLKTVDVDTFDLDSIVEWLMIRPRYIADKVIRKKEAAS